MKGWIAAAVVAVVVVGAMGMYAIGVANSETRLRNAIIAKQKDNTSEFDNMWKKIKQATGVADMQKQALLEIFTGYAEARAGATAGGDNATLMAKWVGEAVPNVDTSTFNQLMNILVSSRDNWTMRQKELIDINREHENLISMFPSSVVCSMLGRGSISITVVTSGKTEEAFRNGQDNDLSFK